MLLSMPITWLARANRIAGLIGVYLSNPFTFLPMYFIDYRLGAIVLKNPLTFAEFQTIVAGDGTTGWLDVFTKVGVELAVPMFVGGIILGTATGVLGYFGTRWLVSRFHRDGSKTLIAMSAPLTDTHQQSTLTRDASLTQTGITFPPKRIESR
jgi:uncharacterized protein (DUF2062 family)